MSFGGTHRLLAREPWSITNRRDGAGLGEALGGREASGAIYLSRGEETRAFPSGGRKVERRQV